MKIDTEELLCLKPGAAAALDGEGSVRAALHRILGSEEFSRAQRMRELLQFLVEQKLSGKYRDTHEYAVGIEVFRRDPALYNTCTDPIVRVQMGRLRDRLRSYYGTAGMAEALRFVIPIGSYMPEIVRMAPAAAPSPAPDAVQSLSLPLARHYLLGHSALAYFDHDPAGAAFAHGLDEELVHQLYGAFGAAVLPYSAGRAALKLSHRLEGSVRIDNGVVRLALRLVDNRSGSVVWSQQFDRSGALAIGLQEQLAGAACAALAVYFAQG